MRKFLPSLFCIVFAALNIFAQAPVISYSGPQTYTIGTAITPLTVSNTGGAVPGANYQKVTTFAGNVNLGYQDGTGTAAAFYAPSGLATDAQGNVYVADQQNNLIRKITPAGVVTTIAGNGYFNNPCGVAVDASGNIFVTDRYNSLIRKVTPAGVITTFAGGGSGGANGTGTAAGFNYPYGITIDAQGNLYVAEQLGYRIRKITPAAVVTTLAGSGSYGSDNGTGTAATFANPTGVAVDAAGNVFVAENAGNLIRKITPAGVVTTFAGSGQQGSANGVGTAASFFQPTGLTVDAAGNVYVADQGNSLIRMITPDGTVSTFAGSVPGYADGTGTDAKLFKPTSLAFDASANLFIADYTNNMIRLIGTTGFTVTPALPEGLTLDGKTGAISGTPTALVAATDYTITAINAFGSSTAIIKIGTVIPAVPPTVTSASPLTAGVGFNITLTGTNFLGATAVTVGGVAAGSFQVVSSTTITATVGAGATSGNIVVTNPYGTGTLSGLTILPPPAISYSGPQTYATGVAITPLAPSSTGSPIPAAGYRQVSTFAGNGAYGSTNGTGTAASFANPNGITADAQGNLYVIDAGSNRIRKITPAGVVTNFAGSGSIGSVNGTGTAASFNFPTGLATDASGNIYVADRGNNQIRKITPAGVVTTVAGTGAYGINNGAAATATFSNPSGIAVDASGNVFVIDPGYALIRKITPEGVVSTFAGTRGNGTLDGTGLSAGFTSPYAIAIDASDNLYVTEADYSNRIRKITPTGEVTTLAGNGTAGFSNGTGKLATFNNPRGIAVGPDYTIYVCEYGNFAVRMISKAGVVTTLAGFSGAIGNTNGDAGNAAFGNLTGLTFSAGSLYLTDYYNNMVRSISLTGYTVTPDLPKGLNFDNKTGTISGNPLAVSPATDYTVSAINNYGLASAKVNITTQIPAVPPVISSSSSLSTGAGQAIVLTGVNFLGATGLTVGGVAVTSFIVNSPNSISVIIPPGAVSGDITVTNPYGTGTLTGFVFLQPPNISYTNPLPYTIGLNVTPLSPANSGSSVPAYVYQLTGTLASGSGNIGKANGPAVSATFNLPYAVANDVLGNTYVADQGNNLIRKITPDGVVSTLAGSGLTGSVDGTGTAASFNGPYGIAVDIAGNVFVADRLNNKIRKITPDGVVSTLAGSGQIGSADGTGNGASFFYPIGLTVDVPGNVYVADQQNHRIRKITPEGVVTTFAGNSNTAITNGTGTSASFVSPTGIIADVAGNLFVSENTSNIIRKITPAGVVTTLAGSGAAGMVNATGTAASFSNPTGLAVDVLGNVYVADQGNNMIRMITPDAVVTTFGGTGATGYVNAVGPASIFNRPTGVSVDGYGDLNIADQNNNRIRAMNLVGYKVSPALPAGLTLDSKTGLIAGKPTVLTPEADYSVTAFNTNGSSTTKVKLSVIPVSTDPSLGGLSVTNINMLPAFVTSVYNYTATVNYSVNSVAVTSLTNNRYANISVNGKSVISGTASEDIPLAIGVNAITVNVTAQDGVTKQAYVVTITRNKFVQTLAFPALTAQTYGDADIAPGATSNSTAFPVTYSTNNAAVATIVNNKIHIVSAGTVNITASQSGDTDYQTAPDITIALTINPKAIAVTADAKNKIYGDTDPALTYTITSGGLVGTDAFTGSQVRDAGEPAGSYAIKQGTLALNANYILTYNGSLFTINPKPISITAAAKTKVYGEAEPALTYIIPAGALVGTDTFTGSLVRDAGEATGAYAIKQGSVAITSNYVLTYIPDNLTITPRLVTVTSAAKAKTYGEADPAFTYAITSGNLVAGDVFTGAQTREPGSDAGTYNILQGTLALSANYALTYQSSKLTVAKKDLLIIADDQTRNFGKADPVFSVSYQGFITGEDATKLTFLPVVTTVATASSVSGNYPLVPAGAQSVNYNITYRNGTFSIIPAANNFRVSSASVTCKGQNNGSITVAATQAANYTVVLTGNGQNRSFTFTTTQTVDNLPAGSYHVCVSDAALPSYQLCYDMVITEPKDLSVYSTVNKNNNTVDLALSGSTNYNIALNGVNYNTTNSSITLPLHKGINKLMVTADKVCQGIIQKELDIVIGMTPFPSPFQDVLYVNLGDQVIGKSQIKIYSVNDGSLKLSAQFLNMSGVVRLNTANLLMGVYSLHLITDGTETIYKVIKQ